MSKSIIKYFTDIKAEISKVTWPTREQTFKMTITVLVFSIFFAIFLGGIDYIISFLLNKFVFKN